MAFLIKTRLPRARTSVIEQEADFAVRAAFALLQQELAFAGIAPSRFELTETEMRARAGSLFKQAYRSCARDK